MSVDPGQLHSKVQDIHYDVSISSGFDEFKQLKEALVSNKSRLKLWQETWLPDVSDLEGSFQRNWGNNGRDKVRELLAGLAESVELLKDADNDAEVDSGHAKLGRKPIRRLFMLDRPKKPQVSTSTSRSALDVALDLSQAVDRLLIHSEILYDIYHGIKAPKDGSSAIEWQISRSLYVRNGAIALYQACQRSTQHCELDLDLLRDRSMPPDPQTTLYPAFDTSTFYQIFVRSGDDSKLNTWDITAKSLDKTEAAAVSPTVKVHKEPDFSVFKSSSPSSTIGIQPSYSRENYYFRVTTAHTIAEPLSKNESSALPFKSNTIPTEVGASHSLTFMAKVDLP